MFDEFKIDPYILILLGAGLISLLAAVVPNVLRRRQFTPPVVYLLIGMVLAVIGGNYTDFDILQHGEYIKRISEFVVIIALTNAGLKIKKPFSYETWKYSLRLLIITMPLTIIAAAWCGYWILGLAPATAILFGAIISPTDPVLASDFQTSKPSKEDDSEIRLGLTSEAGLNDGLAFPFTFFAIYLVSKGMDYSAWATEWLMVDVLYKITVGTLIGFVTGWLLFKIIFRVTSENHHSRISRGILSLALTLLPYAIAELLHSYGFIAVFISACVFSRSEEKVKHMDSLHDFTEETERIFVAFLFIVVGIYVTANFENLVRLEVVATALLCLFLIRPLAGWIALTGMRLRRIDRFVLSFYGIRGVGSVYYLMYAFQEASFPTAIDAIQLTTLIIVLSVLLHGLSASMITSKIS